MDEFAFTYFQSLSEHDKRHFAGLEAERLGWHGVKNVSQFYKIHPNTVRKGKQELHTAACGKTGRIRREGGGRKRAEVKDEHLEATFLDILKDYTAGDPMDENIRWTNLSDKEISRRLKERGLKVGVSIVKRLLKQHGYHRRKAVKSNTFKEVPGRNEQFEKILDVREAEQDSPNPLFSIDTKKKNSSESYIEKGACM